MPAAHRPLKPSKKRRPRRETASPSARPGWWPWENRASAILLIVFVGLAAYAGSFWGAFVYDDLLLFDSPRFGSIRTAIGASMRPIVLLSFYANHQLHETDVVGYHVVNLAIHLAAAVTLMEIVRLTLRRGQLAKDYAKQSLPLALVVALLWTVHPLQTQSVTYIYQRFESLMGLFFQLGFYGFVRAVDAERPAKWYVGSVVCWLLALGSKEVAIVLPVLVLWYDRAMVSSSWREILRRRWAYYGAFGSVVGAGVTAVFLRRAWYASAGVLAFDHVSPLEYARSQPGVILHYLRLAFWPQGQCIDYRWPIATTLPEILGPLVLLGTLLGLTIWCTRRYPAWGFLGGWFFLTLAPTSSFAPIVDLAYEHRMYLALAPVVAATVFAAYGVLRRSRWFVTLPAGSQRNAWVGLVAMAVIALGGTTVARNAVYRDEISLWSDTVAKAPWNDRAMYNLGCRLLDRGDHAAAIELFRRALQIAPEDQDVRMSLAGALVGVGQFDEAVDHCLAVLRDQPRNVGAMINLASALGGLGRQAEAIQHGRAAVEAAPSNAKARATLASLLAASDPEEALGEMSEALRLNPKSPAINLGMGNLLAQSDPKAAIQYYETAVTLQPEFAEAHFNLANAWVACGRPEKAISHLEAATRLRPQWAEAKNNLRILRGRLGSGPAGGGN